jgi:hydroxyacylglutathione hydrolase
MTGDLEIVDNSVVFRRVVVGPLDTNCWMIVDAETKQAVVIEPGDEPERLVHEASDLKVTAVALTHCHWDHVLGLPAVADAWGCLVHAHPDEAAVWPHETAYLAQHGHFDAGTATAELLGCGCSLAPPPGAPAWRGTTDPITHGQLMRAGSHPIEVIHTPGHTPGSVSLRVGQHVFVGDTMFPGGPGLTGWPLSDFPTIIRSIQTRLMTLPDDQHVHPGHGRSTTIGTERPHVPEWIERGR